MTQPIITEDAIREGATAEAYQRGRQYFQRDAVGALTLHGRTLTGEVKGSRSRPYRVTCELPISAAGGIMATCTCPYEWGGWCKHVVAVLLAYIADVSLVAARPPLADVLATLNRDQLQATLLHLVAGDGELADAIERYVAMFTTTVDVNADGPATATDTSPTQVDVARLRREVKTAIRTASRSGRYADDDYYDDYDYDRMGEIWNALQPLIRQATDYVEAGEGRNALRILAVITDEFLTVWASDESESDGGYGFFRQVGRLWAEALLSEDFTRDERKTWAQQLSEWANLMGEYAESSFGAALTAASEGWDHPQLQRILRDELDDEERRAIEEQVAQSRLLRHPWLARLAPDGSTVKLAANTGVLRIDQNATGQITVEPYYYSQDGVDDSGDELIQARLRVLARQGRYDEYLAFARLLGEPLAYTTMLVQRGRLDEAATYGREQLRTTDGALALAKALLERDAPTLAFTVAERGLALGGRKSALARWLRDAATERGATALALAAALALYQEDVSLDNYLAAQRLAGDDWPTRREGLLASARQSRYNPAGPVDIFLHEGLLDDAINALGSPISHSAYSEDSTLNKVIDVAVTQRPEWVIQTCRALAERIMDEGHAGHYEDAARLLGKAREAYLGANRKEEWQTYLGETLERHRRKYKLTPLLKALA